MLFEEDEFLSDLILAQYVCHSLTGIILSTSLGRLNGKILNLKLSF